MKLELLQDINETAIEETNLLEAIDELVAALWGNEATSKEKALEIWNEAESSTKQIVNEVSAAAMGRAGEMEFARSGADATNRAAKLGGYRPSLGLEKNISSPKPGDFVMIPGGGVGQIVDVDPPSGKPERIMIQTRKGGEKVMPVRHLGNPKQIKGRDGQAKTAWQLV